MAQGRELPDFDEMLSLADMIKNIMIRKAQLEYELSKGESITYKTSMTDPNYFVGNKQPSVAYVKSVYEYGGLQNELLPLRKELGEVSAELENLRLRFDVMKMMVDLYRTDSANKRASL